MKPAISHPNLEVYCGDALDVLSKMPDEGVQMCVTSPPYWGLRDYGVEGQIGLEKTPEEFIAKMVAVFAEVRRVLKKDGTLWCNIGDSYASAPVGSFNGGGFKDVSAQTGGRDLSGVQTSGQMNKLKASGLKPKDLCGIPWMLAFALRADGWYLRSDIIWHKPNPMPESVTDRPTKSHEYIFLLTKSERYFYDGDAIKEEFADDRCGNPGSYNRTTQAAKGANNDRADLGFLNNGSGWNSSGDATGRNKRSVWTVATSPFSEAHFATYPPDLIKPCILAGSRPGDTVLDPFGGSGTSGQVALELGRKAILIELNPKYIPLIDKRTLVTPGLKL